MTEHIASMTECIEPQRMHRIGDRALLIDLSSLHQVIALHERLTAAPRPGVIDVVPAAGTVLIHLDPLQCSPAQAQAWVHERSADTRPGDAVADREVTLQISYNGADLREAAVLVGLSPEALTRQHLAARWVVAFTGFAPGFGYLISEQWPHDLPRRSSPRTRVPAGAVGLAAQFTGAYPRETPGGWQLIGTTSSTLFDLDADTPSLLTPGTRVRFHESNESARELIQASVRPSMTPPTDTTTDTAAPGPSGDDPPALQVIDPGPYATIQDLGRAGAASQGVAVSGALDREALRIANRLLGNHEGAAAIEITMGGFRARAQADVWASVTGGWGPITVDGAPIDHYSAFRWPRGTDLRVDWFEHGARGYLAVRGGCDGPTALGSRATDGMAGLGPAPLQSADIVGIRADVDADIPAIEVAPWSEPHDQEILVQAEPGPRADWFPASALDLFFDTVWTVSAAMNRVGMRLEGPALERARQGELPSEGMLPGAIQVPPSGQPTILLAEGPVTGGYPVIAVVADVSLDALAQARPGTRIRFRHAH